MNIRRRRQRAKLAIAAVVLAIVPLSVLAPLTALGADGVTANEAKGIGLSTQWRGSKGLSPKARMVR